MSEEIKNEEVKEEDVVETAEEVVETTEEATPEKSELDLANERADEFENKYLRAHAEMQNIHTTKCTKSSTSGIKPSWIPT